MIVYIVQKLDWEWNDEFYVLENDFPIKAFESLTDAEAYREKSEAESREQWQQSRRDHVTYIGEYGKGLSIEAFYEVIPMELEP